MSITAASPCPDSIARCSGVLPTRSPVFKRGFGLPSGGFSKSAIKAVEPVVAARCLLGLSTIGLRRNCECISQWQLVCAISVVDLIPIEDNETEENGSDSHRLLFGSAAF